MEEMKGGFFLQAGVYHIAHKNGKTKVRTRGADPRKVILRMEPKQLMINAVLPEWCKVFVDEKSYRIEITIRMYMTAGAACASRERFVLIGRWSDVKRKIDIHGLRVKRMLCEDLEYYCSGRPISGPIDRKLIRKHAAALSVPEKDIAACLRSGEALRCRFLVPSLPSINPTPDVLSAPREPDWLNPEFDDDTDTDLGLDLTEEDEDTGDILIGGA